MDRIELLNKLYIENTDSAFDKYKHILCNTQLRIANGHNELDILKLLINWKREH